ncbi:MAG: phosphatase PAP2 family protein [Candidatus Lokiarchaeota archaeon]|nr:phosphatase PAP2 family protein [Candidatus Lokiarchaeota archaeon]
MIAIATSILVSGHLKEIKKQKIGFLVAVLIGTIFCFSGIFLDNLKMFIAGCIIAIPPIIFAIFTFNKDWRKYFVIALIIGCLALFNTLILANTIKIIWGRVRFYDVLKLGDTAFTPWYLPNGPSIEHTSFPSGHTTMAFIFLPLLIIVKEADWKKLLKISVSILILAWGIFIAITRVIYGAHYLSDVLFASGFTVLFSILLYKFLYLKKDIIEKMLGL